MTLIHVWFGGRFSPPTADHIRTVSVMIHELQRRHEGAVVHVYFVPISKRHGKASVSERCVSEYDRLEMLRLEIAALEQLGLPRAHFHLSMTDMDAPVALKTIDSVQRLVAKYGIFSSAREREHLYIALEQCSMQELLGGEWYMGKELLHIYKFIVFPSDPNVATDVGRRRSLLAEFEESAKQPVDILILPALGAGVDSKVARRLARTQDWRRLSRVLIPSVLEYIHAHKVYRGDFCEGRIKSATRKRNR